MWIAPLLWGCGVLATPGSGDSGLPDARLGPFRAFGDGEVSLPPLVLIDFAAQLGGPEVAAREGGAVELIVHSVADGDTASVLRRATSETPTALSGLETILAPGDGEPGLLDPSVLVTESGDRLVYYGLESGERIEVARERGEALVPEDAPVLEAEDALRAPIGAPSVVLVDGIFFIYYAQGDSIALATSEDGFAFVPRGVVLGPGEGWDAAAVSDPEAISYVSPLGVTSVRLYYTGLSGEDPPVRGVGVAASLDGRTEFSRFVGNPIVALDGDEASPTIAPGGDERPALLYFTRPSGSGRAGIGGAIYPGTVTYGGDAP